MFPDRPSMSYFKQTQPSGDANKQGNETMRERQACGRATKQSGNGKSHMCRTYCNHWSSPLLALCSPGSWGRNTTGHCVHPAGSSSILASHIPAVWVRGSMLQMSSLATLNNPPRWSNIILTPKAKGLLTSALVVF